MVAFHLQLPTIVVIYVSLQVFRLDMVRKVLLKLQHNINITYSESIATETDCRMTKTNLITNCKSYNPSPSESDSLATSDRVLLDCLLFYSLSYITLDCICNDRQCLVKYIGSWKELSG